MSSKQEMSQASNEEDVEGAGKLRGTNNEDFIWTFGLVENN